MTRLKDWRSPALHCWPQSHQPQPQSPLPPLPPLPVRAKIRAFCCSVCLRNCSFTTICLTLISKLIFIDTVEAMVEIYANQSIRYANRASEWSSLRWVTEGSTRMTIKTHKCSQRLSHKTWLVFSDSPLFPLYFRLYLTIISLFHPFLASGTVLALHTTVVVPDLSFSHWVCGQT